MSIFKSISDFLVEALTPDMVKKQAAKRKPITEGQRWALAAAAQLTALNRDSNDTLNPDPVKDSATWQSALITWWGVSDHAELLDILNFLKEGGHRAKFRPVLGHDVLAWDLVRLINVARWGYGGRYLSEEEAWAQIMPAASELHARYSSWDALAADYVLGHDAWAEGADPDLNRETRKLLDPADTKSPWNQVAWSSFKSGQ
ncbi:DUF1266 domain-containing protein [Deinococcus altitudinis]|uniref:DUF1266 domain-containing protein n=1 Tax=Deinococcus altitudinis TaxID=468914 RepID=UPI003892517D